jgi:hypothetical protein
MYARNEGLSVTLRRCKTKEYQAKLLHNGCSGLTEKDGGGNITKSINE